MRTRTVVLTGAVLGAVIATAAVVADGSAGDSGGEQRDVVASAAHRDMVTGTVWIADEDGASLTATDAATNNVVATVKGIEGLHNVQVAPDGRSVWAVSGHDSLAVVPDASTTELRGTARLAEPRPMSCSRRTGPPLTRRTTPTAPCRRSTPRP